MKLGEAEKGIGWKAARTARNREVAKKVVEKLDAEHGRNVSQQFEGVEPAGEYQVVALSVKLNAAMQKVPDPGARSWVKMFNRIDDDGSGKIAYREFERMIRGELKVGVAELGKEEVKGLWKALDEDSSGLITIGEFGKVRRTAAPSAFARAPTARRIWPGRRSS